MAIKSANIMLRQVQSAPVDGTRRARCPSCGRVAGFKFVGIQNGGRAPVVLWLWLCGACGSVRAQKSLVEPVSV
jgi:ribosomal protein S27AE